MVNSKDVGKFVKRAKFVHTLLKDYEAAGKENIFAPYLFSSLLHFGRLIDAVDEAQARSDSQPDDKRRATAVQKATEKLEEHEKSWLSTLNYFQQEQARKTAVRKTAAKKAPAEKVAAKKSVAKKAPAKKAVKKAA